MSTSVLTVMHRLPTPLSFENPQFGGCSWCRVVGIFACVLLLVSDVARAADDDVVVVDDGEASVSPDGSIQFGEGQPDSNEDAVEIVGDDDTIIILEGDQDLAPPVDAPTGPLGRVWDAWHVAFDSEVFAAAQLTDAATGPFRMMGSVWLESWLLPAPNLSFYGTALGRLAWDGTPGGRIVAFADVYELYGKVTLDRATVQMGRLVVPWGRTQGVGFGDRLHPPDLRRGPPFPDPARQKQPQLGAQIKGSVDLVGVEAVAFISHEATEGSLAAANQGGLRLGRYQTALARSPTLAGGLLGDDDTSGARQPTRLMQPTLAARAWRRVGEFDVTASAAWHFDETPTLALPVDVNHAIAGEGLALLGLPQVPGVVCPGLSTSACLGPGALTYQQTTSYSLDVSWGLGIVVVRAEGVAHPRIGDVGGKTALLLDENGIRSAQVSQLSTALAVEGQLGPAVDGSLELFDVAWDGVPRDARLWGVELLDDEVASDTPSLRTVHRLAGAAVLGGALFDERVRWRLRGEASILQADILVSAEVRYRLPVLDLYVGARGDLFAGRPGSPGWMRHEASLLGIYLGEGG